MSFHYSPNIDTEGLQFYIDAANPKSFVSGSTIAYDLSKNIKNGTLINGVDYSSLSKGSFSFDGTNDIISIPSLGALSDFTISTWFQVTDIGNTGATIYSTIIGAGSANRILVGTGVNKIVLAQMGGTDYISTTTCPFNVWNNVTYTYNSTTNIAQLYVNNIKQTPQSNSSVTYTSNPHYIGSDGNPPTNYLLEGYISNISIYNRTLSEQEVLQNYNTLKSRYGL